MPRRKLEPAFETVNGRKILARWRAAQKRGGYDPMVLRYTLRRGAQYNTMWGLKLKEIRQELGLDRPQAPLPKKKKIKKGCRRLRRPR